MRAAFVAACAAALALVAPPTVVAQSQSRPPVGVVLPLSGLVADVGVSLQRGLDLAFASAPPSEAPLVIYRDDQCSPAKADNEVQSLTDQKAVLVVGVPCTGSLLAIVRTLEKRKVPLLALGSRPVGLAAQAETTSQSLLFGIGADMTRVAALESQPIISTHKIDIHTRCLLTYDDHNVGQPSLCAGIVVDDAEYQDLKRRFDIKFRGESLSALSLVGYSAGLVILQTLRQTSKPDDPAAIASTLRSKPFATPIGVLSFAKRTQFEPVYHVAVPKDANPDLAAKIRAVAKDSCEDCKKSSQPSAQACPQSNVFDVRSADDCCKKSKTPGNFANACPQGSYIFGVR